MPKPIQINIPDLCSQNWDEMAPDLSGRFCGHCQKTVIDFTSYSDTALYQYFSKNNSHVCGRFLSTQLDRPINIPYQPHSQLYRIAVAFGMTLLFTQTPQLLAQHRPPKTEKSSVLKPNNPSGSNYGEIQGRVIDDRKEPLINATVEVYQNNVLESRAVTDYDGRYIIKPLKPGRCQLVVTYPGYETIRKDFVVIESDQIKTQDFFMGHHGAKNGLTNFAKQEYQRPPEIIVTGSATDLIAFDTSLLKGRRGNSDLNENQSHESGAVIIKPLNDSESTSILQQIQAQQQQMQPDQNNPTKRTFTREEINQTPH